MSFAELYAHAETLGHFPVVVELDLVPKVKELTGQDRVYFTAVELDTAISLGHIKQYRESQGVYGDSLWVTDIRYSNELNICWRRYVGCKELMHVFDTEAERSDSAEKFLQLLAELESTPPQPSPMFLSENRTKWQALAVLCPLPARDSILARRANGELSDNYDVALELRLPEAVVPTILNDRFPAFVAFLAGR